MAVAAEVVYMLEPPDGQGRWDAGTRLAMMQGVGAFTMFLATVTFSLRVFTRIKLVKKPLHSGDYMVGISTIFCWAFYAITLCRQLAGTTHCIDKGSFYLAAVVVNVAIDFIIILLPIPVIAPLQMPPKRKITLCLLFATGGFTIAAAIVNSILTIKLFQSDDYNWEIAMEFFWMYSELASCVICASASSLKPLFSIYVLPKLSLNSSNGSSGNTSFSARLSRRTDRRARDTHTAIELESDDDHPDKSDRRSAPSGSDDQERLWSRVANHGLNEPPQTVNISSRTSEDRSSDWNSGTPLEAQDGINIVQQIDVDYGSSRLRSAP